MNRHHGGGDQADRMLRQRVDHFLAPLATNEVGFALLVTHREKPRTERRSEHEGRQGYPGFSRDPVMANRPAPTTENKAKRARVAPSRLMFR